MRQVLAGPRGYPVPSWIGVAFLALVAAYVATRSILDLRRRAKSRADETRNRQQSAAMSDARAWLIELGYDIEFEVADGFTWVALRPRTNPNFVIPRYGRGASEDEAIESAVGRYRVEQIGTDNARKPGEPLP
jgi:hypothetical protein